jgi:thiol-disulfide isomerase/thioredoxin
VAVYRGEVNAPEFPQGLEWLNTGGPLALRHLRGKVVLLDFWTYCCINCMHAVPELARLEEKYPEELVVIGVHSAKFTTERETGNIRQAILRYGVRHPVVNDRDMAVWRLYAVRAWPTLVLIDPAGKVFGYTSGEGVFEPLDRAIAGLIRTFQGVLDRRQLHFKIEEGLAESLAESLVESLVDDTPLSFPGKVLADARSGRLFIADTGHSRILVAALGDHSLHDCSLLEVVGTGEAGLIDGDFTTAAFNHPNGMALQMAEGGELLYVADTGNHAIRRVDLARRRVDTLAGTGEQARSANASGAGPSTPLNSPWDVALVGEGLFIAMAGPHQLWRLDLETGHVAPWAGSGREGRLDGPLPRAALAQPSGITTDGRRLYFADSEVSSVRAAGIDHGGVVETIVGGDLFDFGDHDGRGLDARLQHPMDVAYDEGALYVADTYNNKVKRIDLADGSCQTFLGTGRGGRVNGEAAEFDEPEGVSVAAGRLYIADTNNHAVRVADLATRRVETLHIGGLASGLAGLRVPSGVRPVELPEQVVSPGQVTVRVAIDLPEGFELSQPAAATLRLTSSEAGVIGLGGAGGVEERVLERVPEGAMERTLRDPRPVSITATAREGRGLLEAHLVVNYCQPARGLCLYDEARLSLPVRVGAGAGGNVIELSYRPKTP